MSAPVWPWPLLELPPCPDCGALAVAVELRGRGRTVRLAWPCGTVATTADPTDTEIRRAVFGQISQFGYQDGIWPEVEYVQRGDGPERPAVLGGDM